MNNPSYLVLDYDMKRTIIPTFWTVVEICHEILTDSENGIQEETSFLSSPSRPFSKQILHTYLHQIRIKGFSCKLFRPQDTKVAFK